MTESQLTKKSQPPKVNQAPPHPLTLSNHHWVTIMNNKMLGKEFTLENRFLFATILFIMGSLPVFICSQVMIFQRSQRTQRQSLFVTAPLRCVLSIMAILAV